MPGIAVLAATLVLDAEAEAAVEVAGLLEETVAVVADAGVVLLFGAD